MGHSNYSTSSRVTNSSPLNDKLMVYCKSCQSCTSSSSQPHGGAYNYHILVQLIMVYSCPNRNWHFNYSWVLTIYVSNNTAGPSSAPHYCTRPLSHTGTPLAHSPSSSPSSPNP